MSLSQWIHVNITVGRNASLDCTDSPAAHDTADKQFSHPLEGQVAIMCTHARAACEVWSAGGTNTVNLYVFLPVLRENVNTFAVFGKS